MINGKAKGVLHVSPIKINKIVMHVRGKKVEDGIRVLSSLKAPSAISLKKLIINAQNNLLNNLKASKTVDLTQIEFVIDELVVSKGITLKRYRFASRGNVDKNYKRQTNLYIKLGYIEKKNGS